ncbi:hypothetical protein G693_04731, partial [Escherichia coli HVH 17 (4-7473087)]
PVKQIKYRGQVQFLSASPEFGDICHPFLTGSFRFELSLKDIFCSESHISPVRPVFLQAHRRLQAELLHQFSHRFATELKTSFLKLTMDPPVPITSPVFMEDGGYELFHISILVLSLLQ